jgi:hypothetical protein
MILMSFILNISILPNILSLSTGIDPIWDFRYGKDSQEVVFRWTPIIRLDTTSE